MKHKVNSQRKLFLRLAAVLVAVLAFSRVSADDGKVFAGVDSEFLSDPVDVAGLFSSGRADDRPRVTERKTAEAEPEDLIPRAEDLTAAWEEEVAVPDEDDSRIGDPVTDTEEEELPEPNEGEDTDEEFPDPENEPIITEPLMEEQEGPDPTADILVVVTPVPTATPTPTPTPTPVPVKDMSVMTAKELAEYKKTISYPYSLAVTSPIYGDPAVKKRAAVPTQTADDRYMLVTGAKADNYTLSHKAAGFENYAAALARMTEIDVPVWKIADSGIKYESYVTLTVHKALADNVRCIFSDIFLLNIKFPVSEVLGFEYRKVSGAGLSMLTNMSAHSFGAAIDINPGDYDNDLYVGKGKDLRDKKGLYYIPAEVIKIFNDYGWYWGGNFEICTATAHFQYFDDSYLRYASDEPFPVLKKGAKNMDAEVIRNLTGRLTRLGYLSEAATSYSNTVITAVKAFQKANGVSATGTVDTNTWIKLINLTHDMGYVF